jgi:hypothetical protein
MREDEEKITKELYPHPLTYSLAMILRKYGRPIEQIDDWHDWVTIQVVEAD